MADIMKMLQQAQQMQGRMQQVQEELEQKTVTGTAGGGMVTVEADGKGLVRRVKIDRSVVTPDDVEMLEDLVSVAAAEAFKKAKALEAEEMGKVVSSLGLPANMPFNLPF
jgi:hypothetical protein